MLPFVVSVSAVLELGEWPSSPEGEIILDETGKANGRGVYLCPKKACLQKARKAKRLEKSLNLAIPEEVWNALEEKLDL